MTHFFVHLTGNEGAAKLEMMVDEMRKRFPKDTFEGVPRPYRTLQNMVVPAFGSADPEKTTHQTPDEEVIEVLVAFQLLLSEMHDWRVS